MLLSDFSIKRPVTTVVIVIMLMCLGLLALKKLRWRRTRRWLGWAGSEPELPGVADTRTQAALRRAHALL